MVQDFAKSGRRQHSGAVRETATPTEAPAAAWQLLLSGGAAGLALGLFISFLAYISGLLPIPPSQQSDNVAQQEPAPAGQGLSVELERAAQRLQLEFYQELPNFEVVVDVTPLELPPWQRPQPPASDPPSDSPPLPEAATSDSSALPEGVSLAAGEASHDLLPDTRDAASTTSQPPLAGTGATAEPPATVSGTPGPSYLLQVGAFQQENSARQQRDRLLSMGLLDSHVRQEALLGRTLFLVQTGPYSREQATQVERILRSNNIDSMRISVGNR